MKKLVTIFYMLAVTSFGWATNTPSKTFVGDYKILGKCKIFGNPTKARITLEPVQLMDKQVPGIKITWIGASSLTSSEPIVTPIVLGKSAYRTLNHVEYFWKTEEGPNWLTSITTYKGMKKPYDAGTVITSLSLNPTTRMVYFIQKLQSKGLVSNSIYHCELTPM